MTPEERAAQQQQQQGQQQQQQGQQQQQQGQQQQREQEYQAAAADPRIPDGFNFQIENALGHQLSNFKKAATKYYRGQLTWDMYMDLFTTELSDYSLLKDIHTKKVLYSKLQDEAFQMASPEYHPGKPDYVNLTLLEYAKKLGELFEPESESGQAKLSFEHRVQNPGEHPGDYFQHKLGLFHKAYKMNHRDYDYFYGKVIVGLTNQEMRNYLRLHYPKPLENTKAFRSSLMEIGTIVRRKFIDGEISEAETMGAEAYTIIQASRGKNESINALYGQKPRGVCYHCKSKDHFIAQCPRKAAGLPATVSAFPVKDESNNQVNRLRFNGPTRTFPSNKPKVYKKPFQPFHKQKGKQGRVMFVYEDEEGELQCEAVEGEIPEEENNADDLEETPEGVHMIENQDDFTESDYMPGSFLGQN